MSQAGSYNGGGGGGGTVNTLTGNAGGAVGPTAGNIDVLGGDLITTTGNPGTSTLTIDLDNGADGQLIIGGGAAPAWADLTSTGGGLVITPGPNTLNIETSGDVALEYIADVGSAVAVAGMLNIVGAGSISTSAAGDTITISSGAFAGWVEVVGVAENMSVDTGYVTNNLGTVTLTLPAVAAFGDEVEVSGKGAGGWVIAQNAGQTIFFGNQTTTTGVLGSLASTHQRDAVRLVCVTANNDWNVISCIGNIMVT